MDIFSFAFDAMLYLGTLLLAFIGLLVIVVLVVEFICWIGTRR